MFDEIYSPINKRFARYVVNHENLWWLLVCLCVCINWALLLIILTIPIGSWRGNACIAYTPAKCIRLSYFVNLLFAKPANRAIESGSQSQISSYANYTHGVVFFSSYFIFRVMLLLLSSLRLSFLFRCRRCRRRLYIFLLCFALCDCKLYPDLINCC